MADYQLIPVDEDPFASSLAPTTAPPTATGPTVPMDVITYMASHPSYADTDKIPMMVPPQYAQAVQDALAREQVAGGLARTGNGRESALLDALGNMRAYPNMAPATEINKTTRERPMYWEAAYKTPAIGPYLRDVASGAYLRQGAASPLGQYMIPVDHDPFQ